jgi:hypothetical protein
MPTTERIARLEALYRAVAAYLTPILPDASISDAVDPETFYALVDAYLEVGEGECAGD